MVAMADFEGRCCPQMGDARTETFDIDTWEGCMAGLDTTESYDAAIGGSNLRRTRTCKWYNSAF